MPISIATTMQSTPLPGSRPIWPVASTLSRLAPFVAPALVRPETFDNARALTAQLPDVASNYYLEMRLGDGGESVDLACNVAANDGRRSGVARTSALCQYAERTPAWATLAWFLRRWAEPTPQQERTWPALWLGFDGIETCRDAPPAPCISMPICDHLGQPRTAAEGSHAARLMSGALAPLLGQPLKPCQQEQLIKAFTHLPADAQVMYGSVMLARADRASKINVLIRGADVLGYLRATGWRGSLSEIEALLAAYTRPANPVRLDLTLGESSHDRLGIELLSKKLPQSPAAAMALADVLHDQGLCSSSQRQALRRWWGYSTERYPAHSWSTCLTRTWYIKLCWRASARLQAKAYLGFMPRPFSPYLLEAS